MPQSLGVLDPAHGDVHDPGRCLHPSVRVSAPSSAGARKPFALDEPERLAEACHRLGLRHVVITSVTRDDLPDGGADHFRQCVLAVRERTGATIEVLTPDFDGRGDLIDIVLVSHVPRCSTTTSRPSPGSSSTSAARASTT